MFPEPTTCTQGSLRRYQGEHEAHAHDHAQVLLGVEGCLDLEIEGRGVRVDASAGLVVPAGARHCYEACSGARVWVIDTPDGPGLDRVRSFAPRPGWSMQAPSMLLLDMLATAPRVFSRRRVDTARLEAAISGALHEDWTTARMAELFAMSVPRFHARWSELTGLAPQAWLRQRRLDAAARLLRSGRNLDAAAIDVGYSSASALAFALRRDLGMSAKALRKG